MKNYLLIIILSLMSFSHSLCQCGCDVTNCYTGLPNVTLFNIFYGDIITLNAPPFPPNHQGATSYAWFRQQTKTTDDPNSPTSGGYLSPWLNQTPSVSQTLDPLDRCYCNVSSNPSINNAPTFIYFVCRTTSITNNGSNTPCFYGRSFKVVFNKVPAPSIINQPVETICQGDSILLKATKTIGELQWFLNSSNNFIGSGDSIWVKPNTSSIYYVKAKNGSSSYTATNSDFDTINLEVLQSPIPLINPLGNATFCQGESVILSANSGIGLSYQWQNNGTDIPGATADSYTATTSGLYTVTAINSSGCSNTSAGTIVTANSGVVPIFNTVSSICQGNTLSPFANTSNNNISGTWSPAPNNTATTTYTFTPNSGQCASTATMTVTVHPSPAATITPDGSTTFCIGEAVTLNANIETGLSYQWQNNGTDIPGATADNYTATASGSYSIVIANNNGCSNVSTATNVTVNSYITPLFTAIAPICQGDIFQLPNTSENGINGTWSPALDNTATATYTFTPTTGQCASTTTMNVTVHPSPAATITTDGSTTFCQGESVILSANTGTGLSYQWQNNGTEIPGATADNYTATASGSYSVVIANNNGCSNTSTATNVTVNSDITPLFTAIAPICQGTIFQLPNTSENSINGTWEPAFDNTATVTYTFTPTTGQCATTATMTVTVHPAPVATITANGATQFCQGESVSLNANIGAGLSYQWQNNGTAILGATSSSYLATTSDSYAVVVTNSNGCSAISSPIAVIVFSSPQAIITASGPTSFCQGGSVVLNANTSSGLNYQWQYNSTDISGLGATSGSYVVTVAGDYTVNITNNNGCTTTSQPVTVVINIGTVPTFTVVSPLCQGSTISQLPSISTNNITGSWSPNLNNSATTTYTFTPTTGQCATTATMTISVIPAPDATVSASGTTSFCNGNSVTLNANTGTGLIYQWQKNGTDISGATSISYNATAAGFYRVVVSNNLGCVKTSANTMISIIPSPNVSLTPFSNLCDTLGLFQLSGGSPSGGTYSGASVSNSTFNTSVGVGTYPITYSYTDNNGCSASNTQDLTVINCNGSTLSELHMMEMVLYPNPTHDNFTLEVPTDMLGLNYLVTDFTGRIILQGKISSQKEQIELQTVANGSYFFQLEGNRAIKVIKQ